MKVGTPVRVAGVRFNADGRRVLKPGERVIGGRVYYSAAWLGRARVIGRRRWS
jgi:hypothetical protein